jgi:hypothetical protein
MRKPSPFAAVSAVDGHAGAACNTRMTTPAIAIKRGINCLWVFDRKDERLQRSEMRWPDGSVMARTVLPVTTIEVLTLLAVSALLVTAFDVTALAVSELPESELAVSAAKAGLATARAPTAKPRRMSFFTVSLLKAARESRHRSPIYRLHWSLHEGKTRRVGAQEVARSCSRRCPSPSPACRAIAFGRGFRPQTWLKRVGRKSDGGHRFVAIPNPDEIMSSLFSENLRLVLKMLSMSSARLAAELETNKSVVSRWLKGSAQPSAHNLSRLSELVATRVEGFRVLDWERDPRSLAEMFGADPNAIPAMSAARPVLLPTAIWDQMVATAAVRGKGFEGIFRSTRPDPQNAGRYLHEHGMIRQDPVGLLHLAMGSAKNKVEGWMIPLHGHLYCIAADLNSGALLFGIFHGIGASRVDVFDGLIMLPGADKGHSPSATAMLCERVSELSGDRQADERRFAALASQSPVAPEGSVPEHVRKHLARDFGPEQLARGGDWLLNMSLAHSMTRGPDYAKSS